jgi:hypothetical protein
MLENPPSCFTIVRQRYSRTTVTTRVNIIYNSSHAFAAYYYISTREYFEKRLACSTRQNRGPYSKVREINIKYLKKKKDKI